MNIEEFYKLAKGFLWEPREGKDYSSYLKLLLGGYLEAITDIDDACFKEGSVGKSGLKSKIEEVCQRIIECLDLYSHARLDECISKMRDMLNLYMFCTYVLDSGSVWYRSRMVSGNERVLSAKNMFHVPFELVRKIGNNRFSISGYPCLYLSNTIWACWEEMKEPGMEDFCTSLLKPTREIALLDLRLPNVVYHQEVEKVLCSLPLIIACSIEVEYPDDPFKPEYVIPQIVMLALVNHEKYQGCSFTSTKKIDNFDWPDDLLTNVAMPVKCVNETGLCPKLTESFLISNSINYKYEVLKCKISPTRITGDSKLEALFLGPHVCSDIYKDYEGSIFGQMEKILKENYKPYMIKSDESRDEPLGLDFISL